MALEFYYYNIFKSYRTSWVKCVLTIVHDADQHSFFFWGGAKGGGGRGASKKFLPNSMCEIEACKYNTCILFRMISHDRYVDYQV